MTDELFWTKWSAIGQIAGALGTFAAVLTSLYLARRADRPKLKFTAGIRLIVGGGAEAPFPKVIDVTVRNEGSVTAHFSQYGWETGRSLRWPKWLARQQAIQLPGATGMGVDPPFQLAPGTRKSTILGYDNFLETVRNKKGAPFFARVWPLLGARPTRVLIVSHLESGLSITARAERDLVGALYAAEVDRLVAKASDTEMPRLGNA